MAHPRHAFKGSCTSILRISLQPETQVVYHRFPHEKGNAMVNQLFFYELLLIALLGLVQRGGKECPFRNDKRFCSIAGHLSSLGAQSCLAPSPPPCLSQKLSAKNSRASCAPARPANSWPCAPALSCCWPRGATPPKSRRSWRPRGARCGYGAGIGWSAAGSGSGSASKMPPGQGRQRQ